MCKVGIIGPAKLGLSAFRNEKNGPILHITTLVKFDVENIPTRVPDAGFTRTIGYAGRSEEADRYGCHFRRYFDIEPTKRPLGIVWLDPKRREALENDGLPINVRLITCYFDHGSGCCIGESSKKWLIRCNIAKFGWNVVRLPGVTDNYDGNIVWVFESNVEL